jgi:hypothetical protein
MKTGLCHVPEHLCSPTDVKVSLNRRSPRVNSPGTRVAKGSGMFTLSAFFLAAGSVFVSVFFACRQDIDTTRGI